MQLIVSSGDHQRSILAGLKKERSDPASLAGRQALFVVNLAPRKMAGLLSEGMLFDIGYADGIVPVLATPEAPVPEGTRAGQGATAVHRIGYFASGRASRPEPSVNDEPTAPTTASRRARPVSCRSRNTASMPVQCAPRRRRRPSATRRPAVHSSWASVAPKR